MYIVDTACVNLMESRCEYQISFSSELENIGFLWSLHRIEIDVKVCIVPYNTTYFYTCGSVNWKRVALCLVNANFSCEELSLTLLIDTMI